MRFMLYNIRYGTGGKRYLLPSSGYLRKTTAHTEKLIRFMKRMKPDIMGLVEVDTGSYRTAHKNQSHMIAEALGHGHTASRTKYGHRSVAHRIPLLRGQGNAMTSRHRITAQRFLYLDRGVKRLVLETEVEGITVFLVHLAITFGARHAQLRSLSHMVKHIRRPCIVAGDFNILSGKAELALFTAQTGLKNADPLGQPTFPSWAPKRHLDFVLHNNRIKVLKFSRPRVRLSDHLPLICDFEVQ